MGNVEFVGGGGCRVEGEPRFPIGRLASLLAREGIIDKGNNAWHKLYNLCLIIYNNGTNINNLSLNGFCPENYIILHQ